MDMDRYIYDESNGLWYELHGDYYLPCDTPSFSAKDIGIWGQRHLRFIKEHRKAIFANLMSRDVLGDYLTDISTQAEDMFLHLVDQTAEREGVTEQFKADNQIEWVQRMNNIRSRATEIVNSKLIYEQGNHPARKQ